MRLSIKGRDNKIELCFSGDVTIDTAIKMTEEYARANDEFFSAAGINVSYSGITLSYNEEIRFEKALRQLLGNDISFTKQHRLSKEQINYSLDEGETLCLVINKSLRSGEKVSSRGDVLIYGDVNPGATVSARGNITVIGSLRGEAHTTKEGRVYATVMQPTQIRIGKIISYNKKTQDVGTAVAIAENGEIILQCL